VEDGDDFDAYEGKESLGHGVAPELNEGVS